MKGIAKKSVFGAAVVALGASFMMLSSEAAFACHAVGFPGTVGNPSSDQCQALLAAAAAAAAPEIGMTGGLAALVVVSAIGALVYERRTKR